MKDDVGLLPPVAGCDFMAHRSSGTKVGREHSQEAPKNTMAMGLFELVLSLKIFSFTTL